MARCQCFVGWEVLSQGREGGSGTSPQFLLRYLVRTRLVSIKGGILQSSPYKLIKVVNCIFCLSCCSLKKAHTFLPTQCRTYCPSPELIWNLTTMESVVLPLQVTTLIQSSLSLSSPAEALPEAEHVSPECNRSWLSVSV